MRALSEHVQILVPLFFSFTPPAWERRARMARASNYQWNARRKRERERESLFLSLPVEKFPRVSGHLEEREERKRERERKRNEAVLLRPQHVSSSF